MWRTKPYHGEYGRTIADRFWKPLTRVGLLVNFCLKASLRLCAGSVEMMSTFVLTAASCTAKLHEQVVLPAVAITISLYS